MFLLCNILTNQWTELLHRWQVMTSVCRVHPTQNTYRTALTQFWPPGLVLCILSLFYHYIVQYLSSVIFLFCIDKYESRLVSLLHQPNIKTYLKKIWKRLFFWRLDNNSNNDFTKQFLYVYKKSLSLPLSIKNWKRV